MLLNPKRRPPSPELLEQAAREVEEIARQDSVAVAVVGGIAMQHYGSDRFTFDLDVVADEPIIGLDRGKPLSFGGVATTAPCGVKVDVIVRSDEYAALYQEALRVALRSHVGAGLPVVTPEHLAAMKMASGREGKDSADLAWLITSGAANIERTRQIIQAYLGTYAAKEFDQIVLVAQWEASRNT